MKLSEPITPSEKEKRQRELTRLMTEERKRERGKIKVKVDDRTEILIDKDADPQERIDLHNAIRNKSKRFW